MIVKALRCKGFSLIELSMVIVIMTIISLMIVKMYTESLRSVQTIQAVSDTIWQGQLAMEMMSRELRMIRSTSDVSVSTTNEITFTDVTGNSIDYKLSGTDLLRNNLVLARNISAFTLTYLNSSGSTASSSDLAYVGINLTVLQSGRTYSLASSIYLRDLAWL